MGDPWLRLTWSCCSCLSCVHHCCQRCCSQLAQDFNLLLLLYVGSQLLRDMEESYRQRLEVELEALQRKEAAANGGGTAAEGVGTLPACLPALCCSGWPNQFITSWVA